MAELDIGDHFPAWFVKKDEGEKLLELIVTAPLVAEPAQSVIRPDEGPASDSES